MTELSTVAQTPWAEAFRPRNLPELIRMAEMMALSDMVPKDYRGKPGNIVVAVTTGAEIGLSPNQALQSFAVINGRACLWGDAPLALVRGSGLLVEIDEGWTGEGETREAFCQAWRRGDPAPRRQTFSVKDARTAGLWNKEGPWRTAPDRMLKMRARGFLLRDVFPDVLKGVAIAEEVQDYTELDVTPSREGSRADQVRARMASVADVMGATGMTPPPPPKPAPAPVEGDLEPPMPDVHSMLAEQIVDALDSEAHAAGLSPAQAKAIEDGVLQGRKRTRVTAPEIIKAFRRAGKPPATDPAPPPDDAPAQGSLLGDG